MKPLDGKRILITRAQSDAGDWSESIERLGGQPIALPCIRTELQGDPDTARRLHQSVSECDWLVFTSARGVRATAQLLEEPLPAGVRIAVVGARTADAARKIWRRVDLEGDGSGALELATWLARRLLDEAPDRDRPARIVVPSADRARLDIEQVLQEAGAHVTRVVVYRTVAMGADSCSVDLTQRGVDVVLLASPSAVEGLLQQTRVPDDAQVITIGPTTSKAAVARGLRVTAQAKRPDLEGLLEAIQ